MEIRGTQYDIDREDLEILIERDNPAAWIAKRLLEAEDERAMATTEPVRARG